MKLYIYPQNLKATANLWLWSLRDFALICVGRAYFPGGPDPDGPAVTPWRSRVPLLSSPSAWRI